MRTVCRQQIPTEGKSTSLFLFYNPPGNQGLGTTLPSPTEKICSWQALDSSSKSSKEYTSRGIEKKAAVGKFESFKLFQIRACRKSIYARILIFVLKQLFSQIKLSLPSAADRNTAIFKNHIIKLLVNFTCKLFLSELKS